MSNIYQIRAESEFPLLCVGAYLLSLSYGVTFLIPILVGQWGGDEALAGLIISAATVSTVILVILSGHIADIFGTAKATSVSALFLAASGLGFAIIPSAGAGLVFPTLVFPELAFPAFVFPGLVFSGFLLGIGWGLFYTLGPILVAAIISSERRVKYFALLSGSMVSGIGTGPIIGRIATALNLPVESAFLVAAAASLMGGMIYLLLHKRLIKGRKIAPQVSRISLRAACEVMASPAIYSIAMVGIGGAIFGSVSSFQTSYAAKYGFDYSLFFIGFMVPAIFCRMVLAGYIVKKDPLYTLLILTGLTLISIILFMTITTNQVVYFAAAVILGVGYGLTYSVINGLAANETPEGQMNQSLLLFSLAYFVGLFGAPLIAGHLIVLFGIQTMLFMVLILAMASSGIVVFRAVHRMVS